MGISPTRIGAAAASAVAILLAVPASAPWAATVRTVEVTIEFGDTLLKIAARHGVSVDDLKRWNPQRVGRGDLIKAGAKLVVQVTDPGTVPAPGDEPAEEWEGWYDLRSGDTLGGVARKLDVAVEDLRRWNKLRKGQVIRAGDMLRYVKAGPRPPARSDGRPTRGKLLAGKHLGEGRGYRLRFPRNAFGVPEVLEAVRVCAAHVADEHPGTADILVGDISRPTGGRFPPHVSHQSGRDVDIGYYLAGNVQNATMHRVGASHVDHAKNWSLLHCLLTRDEVVRVFMDHRIQASMARYLDKQGLVGEAELARLFEVRAANPARALIRHAPSHDTHIHVRFACAAGDPTCEEEPADSVFSLASR